MAKKKQPSEADLRKMERHIRSQYAGKGYSAERMDRIVYGVKRKAGWTPSHQKKKSKRGKR